MVNNELVISPLFCLQVSSLLYIQSCLPLPSCSPHIARKSQVWKQTGRPILKLKSTEQYVTWHHHRKLLLPPPPTIRRSPPVCSGAALELATRTARSVSSNSKPTTRQPRTQPATIPSTNRASTRGRRQRQTTTCPKCRAILRRAADAPVGARRRRSSNDSSDNDDDHSSLDSQGSEHFGGWGRDPWRPGGRAGRIRLDRIPDLDHTRMYNNPRLRTTRERWSTDRTYVFEIPPDDYYRAIAQELPRRSDMWANANSRMTEEQVPVSEAYMDDDSWQRFQYQTRHWEVKIYQCYWAPLGWNIDFFLLPEYPANSLTMTRLRAMVDRMDSRERIEWLAADAASRNGGN